MPQNHEVLDVSRSNPRYEVPPSASEALEEVIFIFLATRVSKMGVKNKTNNDNESFEPGLNFIPPPKGDGSLWTTLPGAVKISNTDENN